VSGDQSPIEFLQLRRSVRLLTLASTDQKRVLAFLVACDDFPLSFVANSLPTVFSESYCPLRVGSAAMPIYGLIKQEAVFSPEEITAITKAFEAALQGLGLVNRSDLVAETVARKIIELARMGERDPDRLCEQVLKSYGQSAREAC
jgi:hypothetical protein